MGKSEQGAWGLIGALTGMLLASAIVSGYNFIGALIGAGVGIWFANQVP